MKETRNGSSCNQKRSCLKKNRPPDTKLPPMPLTRVQYGRESANLIEQIYAKDQQTIKSNSSTLDEELKELEEEVRKEKKENLEWKKLQRVMELAKKKTQKDTDYANRKKQKETELAEKRKLKELQLAEKKRQKEIEQAEKKRLKEESQNVKRAKIKAIKQQLELSLTVSISPPLHMKQTENVDNDSASVGTLMSVTVPEAVTETKAVNKPSAVPLAVEAAAQSDPISTGENGCGMENVKRYRSKEKKIYEKYKNNDDNSENKKDINKWSSFLKQFKSYSHIDSINGSLRRVESKHTYTKKEKQLISKCKGGYVESSNINETFITNNNTRGRRDLKIENKELKKKKKKGNSNDVNVSNCAFTTVNSVLSIDKTMPTNNKEDDNVINNTNIISNTTNACEGPIVKIASSKSKPVIVNSSHHMKRHTSNSSNTSKISKNKNRKIVGDSKKEVHSTSKASENPKVKTASFKSASVTANSSHQMKQRASNGSTASKILKSKEGKIVGDNNKDDHSIIDNNIIKRSTKVRASESTVLKTASFKSASTTVNFSHQMKQLTSYISLTSKISKNKIEEIVGDNNNEDDSIIENTSIRGITKASENSLAKLVSFKSASVMVNSSLQMNQQTSNNSSLTSKISKNKIWEVVVDNNKKATEDSIAKTVSFKSVSVMANPVLQMDQRTSTSSVASKISKSNQIEKVCENIKKDVSIINNTEIRSTTKANEGPIVKRKSSKSAPVKVKSSHAVKRRISNISIASKISKSKKGEIVGDNNKKDIDIINSIIQNIIEASEDPVVKTGSSKSTPVVNPSLLKLTASNNSNTRKLSKSKKRERVGDVGDNSVKNNGSQSSKGSKSKKENKDYRKRNESEACSRNSKNKDTTSIKESKRSTHSVVNVCSSNNQFLSKKVSVIEDAIVVKELEKIEKEKLDRASGEKQSDAGDGPIAKQSLVFMARRNWRQRRSAVEEEPVVQPDDEKPENGHEREIIPCKKFLEELTSNSEQGVTLSHNLLVLVKLCLFYVKQSMKVMKNFCFIITKDERDPEVTCLTETVGQVMKVFWVMGKEACKCLQCQKIQSQNINEQCT